MTHDVAKFSIGEIIEGAGIRIRITGIYKINGIIDCKIICVLIPEYGPVRGRVIFYPQPIFANSWISDKSQHPPLVLCLRADGRKILG